MNLPNVTLVMIETREHELASLAIKECTDKVSFGEVLVFTDNLSAFGANLFHWGVPTRHIKVDDWPDKIGWSRYLWNNVAPYVHTSHMLVIQWDSWIKDAEMWRDEFLQYDYIGAPWWYKEGKNVGNGGFSLRSTALMRYVRDHRQQFPCTTPIDDDLLCRGYRPALEDVGFVWAPEKVAIDFAFECVRPDKTAKHFGFHACMNFPAVLEPKALLERTRLMLRSPYISHGVAGWKGFVETCPPDVMRQAKELESVAS